MSYGRRSGTATGTGTGTGSRRKRYALQAPSADCLYHI